VAIDVSAPLAAADRPLRVCTRHGQPATRFDRVLFRSRPPYWSYLLLLSGIIPFLIVVVIFQRRIHSPGWPFCRDCGRLRLVRILGGAGLVLLAIVSVIGFAAAAPESDAAAVAGFTLFAVLLVGGLTLISVAGRPAVARGYALPDGAAVRIKNPDRRFVDQVRAAYAGRPS
jgi:hypothetical protein